MASAAVLLGTATIAAPALAAPQAPAATARTAAVAAGCVTPDGSIRYASYLHCYTPQQIRAAYGVNRVSEKGDGQTIVLVDAYGTPTGRQDLQFFHDTFFPNEPAPNFTEVHPLGNPDYSNANGNGLSGPAASESWAGEATLDIEWAYAIAPHAHIVLVGVPPAETLGVQGFPNLFKAVSGLVDQYPGGTVFSMSLGVTEQTFGGAAQQQTAKFDSVFQKGIAKGDTFFASSGDNGTLNASTQQKETRTYSYPTVGWPASSPYVTAVGGTQLQYGWTWNPQSDVPFTASGAPNDAYFNSTAGGNQNVVWNESWLPAATGGGPSAIYSRPSWQQGVLPSAGNHRLVPDVAWNAAVNGGVLVYTSYFPSVNRVGWHVYGGTSAGSPQVAALTALAVQRNGGKGLGNINPAIYGSGGSWFTDVLPVHQGAPGVISGDLTSNRMFDYNGDGQPVTLDPVPGWPVLNGYDMTTGFGTPNAASYVGGLAAH